MITEWIFSCLFKQANKKTCQWAELLTCEVFLSILAHLAHLACSFSLIWNRINKIMFWFKHANTRKHVSKQSWLSGWIILNILAHLAHLARFYFSLIFSAINTYNYFHFDLIDKKDFNDWRQKHGEKWPMLTTFFLTATAAITGILRE